MIQSFRHKGLEDYFFDGTRKGIQPKHEQKLADVLDVPEAATNIQDVDSPGSRLHRLQPKAANRWSVRVSGNWRVTFRFEGGEVYEVDYEDYH